MMFDILYKQGTKLFNWYTDVRVERTTGVFGDVVRILVRAFMSEDQ